MGTEVLKQFLIGLGFGVDEGDLEKFNKAIASASLKVAALYASIQVTAAGIFKSISSISEGFEQMGYEYRLIAPAISKTLELRRAMLEAYQRAGVDIVKVVQQSVKFNFSLAKTKFAMEALYKSVGARFFPILTKQMDIFRGKIYANMPKIQSALEKFIKFIFSAFDATIILGKRVWDILGRVWDFFTRLDQATDGWSTKILLVIAAWKLLNLSFLATPLGMLLTGFLALLTLWDDFKTFKEGGQSFINWGSETTKMVIGLAAGIATVGAAFAAWSVISGIISSLKAFNLVLAVTTALEAIMAAPFWAVAAAIGAVIAALTAADAKWNIFGGRLSGFFSGVGGKILNFVGGGPTANGVQQPGGGFTQGVLNTLGGKGAGPALSGATQPSPNVGRGGGNNQHVSQETNINIQGAPDAHATGKEVASQQDKVNFNMTRNMGANAQ